VDEAYIEFADRPSVLPLLASCDRLIILRTFSKALSMAGLRIGYLLAQPELCSELLKPKIPFTVNNFSASIAIALMGRRALIDERIALIKSEKQRLIDAMQQIRGVKVFPSQTNFLIFTPPGDSQTLFNKFLADHVLIRDVGAYPMLKNTLRVNAGTVRENNAFLDSIRRHLQ
jgi:histidinol-phosphate aminotransferase